MNPIEEQIRLESSRSVSASFIARRGNLESSILKSTQKLHKRGCIRITASTVSLEISAKFLTATSVYSGTESVRYCGCERVEARQKHVVLPRGFVSVRV